MSQATAHHEAYALQYAGESAVAASAGSVNSAGQPTKRFVKDLIRVGKFYGGGGKHQAYEVTIDQHDPANNKFSLQHFRDQFNAMRLAGIDVPTPDRHTDESKHNQGYLRDVFIEGDKLYGVIEAIGEDAIKLAGRAKVSINVKTALQGGNGKTYEYPIDHVAIVTNPVINDQQGFVAIAASNDTTTGKGMALVLSPETPMDTPTNPTTPTTPAPEGDKPKATDLASLAAAMGIEVGEGQSAGDLILAAYSAIKAELKELKDKATDDKPAAEDTMIAASRIDPNVASVLVENADLKLSRLVEDGKITKAVKDQLKLSLVGTAANPEALTLSTGKAGQPSILASIVDILAKNNPVELKEKTKSQSAIAASRDTSKDDEVVKSMTEQANGSDAGVSL